MKILGIRKGLIMAAIVIILLAVCAVIFLVDLAPPQSITRNHMKALESKIIEYAVRNDKLPTDISQLSISRFRDGRLELDGYDNKIVYTKEADNTVTLISYGKDGMLGGEGEDEDIVLTFSWNQ